MSGEARWAATAVTSVVLWYPAMTGTLRGELDMPEGALRYVVALLVAWVAVAFVHRLVHGYAAASTGEGSEPPRRRKDDRDPPAVASLDGGSPDLDLDAGEGSGDSEAVSALPAA